MNERRFDWRCRYKWRERNWTTVHGESTQWDGIYDIDTCKFVIDDPQVEFNLNLNFKLAPIMLKLNEEDRYYTFELAEFLDKQ